MTARYDRAARNLDRIRRLGRDALGEIRIKNHIQEIIQSLTPHRETKS